MSDVIRTTANDLTEDLMCECCSVDYSGYDRDVLDNRATVG